MPGSNSNTGQRRTGSDWEATELGSKGITHTRTVTVEGGHVTDRYGNGESSPRGRQLFEAPGSERCPSPSGSIDPILSGRGNACKTKTEVSVGMQELSEDDEKMDHVPGLPVHGRR